jgi:hypothetical protein
MALLLLALPMAGLAQFSYTTNADGVSITIARYTGSDDAVIIPSVIDGLTVNDIRTNAFQRNSSP